MHDAFSWTTHYCKLGTWPNAAPEEEEVHPRMWLIQKPPPDFGTKRKEGKRLIQQQQSTTPTHLHLLHHIYYSYHLINKHHVSAIMFHAVSTNMKYDE